jgi:hypothetical protein
MLWTCKRSECKKSPAKEGFKLITESVHHYGKFLCNARLGIYTGGKYFGFTHALWVKKISVPDFYNTEGTVDYQTIWGSDTDYALNVAISEEERKRKYFSCDVYQNKF